MLLQLSFFFFSYYHMLERVFSLHGWVRVTEGMSVLRSSAQCGKPVSL